MDGQPYHMFDYWSDKYGPMVALQDYYPKTLESSDELKAAVAQYKNSKRVMNSIMDELKDKEEENDDGLG